MSKVSILTPFRNPMPYFKECLDSIVNQTYSNWQLILINDQSCKASRNLALNYTKKDDRITLINNPNPGLIHALKLGYKEVNGEFITRMDADDIMLPNKLEILVGLLKNQGSGHVACGGVEYFKENSSIGEGYLHYQNWLNQLTKQGNNYDEIYRECVIPSPNFLIFKGDFERIGGFNRDVYPEDYDLAFRMYQGNLKVIPCDTITHKWRDHDTRSTRTQEHYKMMNFIPLKANYFVDISFKSTYQLVLWGAAKKGKLIARMLIERKTPFIWVCENVQRFGHNVYGNIIQDASKIESFENKQVIVAVSNKEEQKDILDKTKSKLINENEVYFFF